MTTRILCVDDDPMLLGGLRRILHGKHDYDVAIGPETGLDAIRDKGPFAVVVADMRMPGMDGAQFLARLREIAPDTIRIMLTGNNDLRTAERAINEVSVFRFLSKPCAPETFLAAIRDGLEAHRMRTQERDILERTVGGSIQALMEILALSEPEIHVRACAIRDGAVKIARHLHVDALWEIEVASMLMHIGWVTLPKALVTKHLRGESLTDAEEVVVDRLPTISSALIAPIPRLEGVADIVRLHRLNFRAAPHPDASKTAEFPLGARILRCVSDYEALLDHGATPTAAMTKMRAAHDIYDFAVIEALAACHSSAPDTTEKRNRHVREVDLSALLVGHVTAGDILTTDKRLLMRAGVRLTPAHLERIRAYEQLVGIQGPIIIEESRDAAFHD